MIFQSISCYGLFDREMIVSPVPTGQWIEVVYIPGCRYVGFKGKDVQHQQVDIHFVNQDYANFWNN